MDPRPRPDARGAQVVAGWLFALAAGCWLMGVAYAFSSGWGWWVGMAYGLSLAVVGAPFLLYGVLRRPRLLLPTVKKVLIAAGGSLALCTLVPFVVIVLDL